MASNRIYHIYYGFIVGYTRQLGKVNPKGVCGQTYDDDLWSIWSTDSNSDSDKFIQQKKIQVKYQVYITFMNIQLIISPWHINDYKHVGRPPLKSYLTADMEAAQKGEACTALMETAMQLIVNEMKKIK